MTTGTFTVRQWKNRADIAREPIVRGNEVDAGNNNGETPLQVAEPGITPSRWRLLIEHDANTDRIDLSWMDDEEDG